MSEDIKVREPFEYTSGAPKKSLRNKLIWNFNKWIGAPEQTEEIISRVIETLHNASLMIDDIEDSAVERRGQPCAYIKFGTALTLNSANLAYFEAFKMLESLPNYPEVSKIFTEEMINLHLGQGSEIYFRDNLLRPTIDEYYRICKEKTGGLFRLSVKLLLKCSENTKLIDERCEELIVSLAEEFGKFYQVRDDYLNLFHGDASDLKEGKFTLPTLFAEIDSAKHENLKERMEIVEKLREMEADQFCMRTLSEMAVEMENLVFEIEQKTCKTNQMKEIIYFLINPHPQT